MVRIPQRLTQRLQLLVHRLGLFVQQYRCFVVVATAAVDHHRIILAVHLLQQRRMVRIAWMRSLTVERLEPFAQGSILALQPVQSLHRHLVLGVLLFGAPLQDVYPLGGFVQRHRKVLLLGSRHVQPVLQVVLLLEDHPQFVLQTLETVDVVLYAQRPPVALLFDFLQLRR